MLSKQKVSYKIRLAIITALLCWPYFLYALPEGENVIEGNATFDRSEINVLKINAASDKLIVDYNSFNIAAGESVYFYQPSVISAALNRVQGAEASNIFGTLTANGIIYLINPSGINIGASANINAASFIASTLNISNNDFLNNNLVFSKLDKNAVIVNQGKIIVRNGGYVCLLAGAVDNQGTIEANLGNVVLASGEKVTLALDDLNEISVVINEGVKEKIEGFNSAIRNSGTITAAGGKVILTAKSLNNVFDYAINNSGIIEATSVVNRNGVIELVAEGAPVINSGTLEAGEIRINTDNGFINKGSVISGDGGITGSGNVNISAINISLYDTGLISADNLVSLTADKVEVVYAKDYSSALMPGATENMLPPVIIQAKQVKVNARQFGGLNSPLNINAGLTSIYRTEGNIDILDSLGIGTSILLRGPPDGFGAIIYNRNTNLTLEANNGSITLSSNSTLSANNLTLTAKEGISLLGLISADDNLSLFSSGSITSLGTLKAKNLTENGGSFSIGGIFDVEYARVQNLDNALTYAADTTINSAATIEDAVNIIVNAGVKITLNTNGTVTFRADSDTDGSGAFTMNAGSSIVAKSGKAPSLTIKASQASTLYSITGIVTLTLEESKSGTNPTLSLNNNLAVTNLNINSAALNINGKGLTVSGIFSNNGTLRLQGVEALTLTMDTDSGTVEYTGDDSGGTITVKDFGEVDYSNLIFRDYNSSRVMFSLNSALDVAGTFTIGQGTFNANGRTVTVAGLTSINGESYNASSATQTFNGGLKIAGGNFIGSTGAVDVNGDFYFSGSSFTAPSGSFTVSGSWNVATAGGTFDLGTGTVTFDGTSSGNTIQTSTMKFYNLTINGALGEWILSDALGVTNNFTLTNGTIDVSSSNYNITIGGNWTNNGTFTPGTGTVTFNGTGTQTLTTGGTGVGKKFYDFIHSGSGTLTLSGDLSIINDFTNSGGTWATNNNYIDIDRDFVNSGSAIFNGAGNTSYTLKVARHWTNASTAAFTANYCNVVFDGGSGVIQDLDSGGDSFFLLTHNGAGTVALQNDLTVSNDFTNSDGIWTSGAYSMSVTRYFSNTNNAEFNAPSTTLHVGHGFTNGADATFNHNNGTVYLTNSIGEGFDQNLTTGGDSFFNLEHSGSYTVGLQDSLNVENNFTNSAGIWISGANAIDINGDFNNSADFTAPSTTMNVAGSWVNSGTFAHNSGTVTFDAKSGTVNITSDSSAFNNVDFNDLPTGVVFSLMDDLDVDGNLTITNGELDANGYAITVAGDWTNNDKFTADSNTVTFDGTGEQYITSGSSNFYNLDIANTSSDTVYLQDALNVDGSLTIEESSTLDVEGYAVTVTGDLANSGEITTSSRDINITSQGNITTGLITNPDGTVTLTSNSGAILDGNDVEGEDEDGDGEADGEGLINNNITANTLNLSAALGIGSDDALETEVSSLTVTNSESGNVKINNTASGNFTLNSLDAANGDVILSNDGADWYTYIYDIYVDNRAGARGLLKITTNGYTDIEADNNDYSIEAHNTNIQIINNGVVSEGGEEEETNPPDTYIYDVYVDNNYDLDGDDINDLGSFTVEINGYTDINYDYANYALELYNTSLEITNNSADSTYLYYVYIDNRQTDDEDNYISSDLSTFKLASNGYTYIESLEAYNIDFTIENNGIGADTYIYDIYIDNSEGQRGLLKITTNGYTDIEVYNNDYWGLDVYNTNVEIINNGSGYTTYLFDVNIDNRYGEEFGTFTVTTNGYTDLEGWYDYLNFYNTNVTITNNSSDDTYLYYVYIDNSDSSDKGNFELITSGYTDVYSLDAYNTDIMITNQSVDINAEEEGEESSSAAETYLAGVYVWDTFGDITVTADNLTIANTVQAGSDNGKITIKNYSDGRTIDLGGSGQGDMVIDDNEVSYLQPGANGKIVIGSATAGTITVGTANFDEYDVELISGDTIIDLPDAETITADDLSLSAVNGIGESENPLNINANKLNAETTGDAAGIYIDEADDLEIGAITSGPEANRGDVSIKAENGSIKDADNDDVDPITNIIGATVTLNSGDDIGEEGNNLEVERDSLSYSAGGDAYIYPSPDNTAPLISISARPDANENGWHNSDVTVTAEASDEEGGSGVASLEYSLDNETWNPYIDGVLIDIDGEYTVYFRATDNIGNQGNGSIDIKLDKTAPTIQAQRDTAANANGWNNSDVTVSYSVSDNLSEIDDANPLTDYSDDVVSGEGANQSVEGIVYDKAGNSATIATEDINIDKTAPVVDIIDPLDGFTYTSAQTLLYTAADANLDTVTGPDNGTVYSAVGPHTVDLTATDLAGNNTAKSISFSIIEESSVVLETQLSNSAVYRPIVFSSGALGMYRFNTFDPMGGPVYFYHPLTETDMSAFEGMEEEQE